MAHPLKTKKLVRPSPHQSNTFIPIAKRAPRHVASSSVPPVMVASRLPHSCCVTRLRGNWQLQTKFRQGFPCEGSRCASGYHDGTFCGAGERCYVRMDVARRKRHQTVLQAWVRAAIRGWNVVCGGDGGRGESYGGEWNTSELP